VHELTTVQEDRELIELTGVTKIYRSGVKAVDNLSLTVQSGELFGFIGPNGAGKSTTIKMMVGLLEPTSGSIKIDGYDIRTQPLEVKKSIAYVPDNPDIYEKLTGIEYLNFIADGVLVEVRKREHYEKPSVRRKKKAEAARRRRWS